MMDPQNTPTAPGPRADNPPEVKGVNKVWLLPSDLLLAVTSIIGTIGLAANFENFITDQVNFIQDLLKGNSGGIDAPGTLLISLGVILAFLWIRFYQSALPQCKILILETRHLKGLPDIVGAITWTAYTIFTLAFVGMNIYAAVTAIL